MKKDWMLMHVYITEGTYVNASGPDFYDSENDAIEAALQNLSEDFGITKEEARKEADIEGMPTAVNIERDGKRDIYVIMSLSMYNLMHSKASLNDESEKGVK